MQKKCFLNLAAAGLVTAVLLPWGLQAQTWQIINANVPGAVTGNNVRPIETDGTRLYVLGARGVYVSSDNGDSFSPINDIMGGSYSLTNMPYRFIKYVNGSLWIGSDPGSGAINFGYASLHRLTPGQTAWQKSSNGFPIGDMGNQADDIAYDSLTGTYYVAAALGGAFVSADGTNWEQRAAGLGGLGVPSSVVAFNGMAFELRPLAQVCKTTNRGTNWTALASHQGISSGYLLEQNGRIMFASAGNNTLQDGFNYSDDFGATWTVMTGLRGTADLTLKDNLVYAAGGFGGIMETVYGRYAFKYSATDGITWDNLPTNGLPVDSFYGFTANRVVRQGNYLFLHSYTSLYRLDVSGFDFTPATQIARQPITSTNRLVGQPFTLGVLAGGTNLTYQWRLNGTNMNAANAAAYTVAAAQTNQSGPYTVVVTGDRGSVTSSVATVAVAARIEGKADITYNSAKTGGQLFLLPDNSLLSVNGATLCKINPDGLLLTSRVVNGSSFTASCLDSSNRLLLVNSSGVNRLRRVNSADLTDDPTFNQLTANFNINAVTELPGRGYLAAGNFSSVTNAGISTNALFSLCLVNYSGQVDANFNAGPSPGGVSRIVVDSGTNIYALGFWTFWNGEYQTSGFVKLNPDGTRDLSFTSTTLGGNRYLKSLAPGKLFAVDSSGRLMVLNANGTRDPSFNAANRTLSYDVNLNAVLGESNKLYVLGKFTSYGGTSVGGYMRLFSDGSIDPGFYTESPTSGGFAGAVYDPRGYLHVIRDTSSGAFQGQAFYAGPYRVFAGTNAASAAGFAAWKSQFTFPPGLDGQAADADGDGILNIFEYYFGSNPTSAASGAQPTAASVNSGGQIYPAITFIRSRSAGGVTLMPQVSSSVLFNDSLGSTVEPVVDLGDGTERVTVRSHVSMNMQAAQFLRIQLSVP